MRYPDVFTTRAQWVVIAWVLALVLFCIGLVAFYKATAADLDPEAVEQLRSIAVKSLVGAGLIATCTSLISRWLR